MKRNVMVINGKALGVGDEINTDLIIAGKYCKKAEPAELARHVFESMGTALSRRPGKGDIIVAGRNFGCGSSREQAPVALKAAGVKAVVASSFARIFFRNAINSGRPVLALPGHRKRMKDGERVRLDIGKGELVLVRTKEVLNGSPLPPFLLDILSDGGLVPHLRKRLRSEKKRNKEVS
jgi:3-isopropylmalate/(R)-2-methylmalate dehydratase small subunit